MKLDGKGNLTKKWDFLLHIKGKKVSRQDKLEAGWEVISR